ncbi:hypothetical protein CEXT_167261 [Caerostris extrusa]|uniref:Uncharacterized protein n=1 Tax=Caerostris extrusa TaxID=172846 RepID=A0AAV4XA62_CAEEX|nr:hypothetical protein CEXT_167261 [Caerostris extrusa]
MLYLREFKRITQGQNFAEIGLEFSRRHLVFNSSINTATPSTFCRLLERRAIVHWLTPASAPTCPATIIDFLSFGYENRTPTCTCLI